MSKKKPGRKKPEPATKPARQKKPEPQKKVQRQVLQPVRKTKPVPTRAEGLRAANRRQKDSQEEIELEQPAEELEQEQPAEELEQEQPAAISPLLLIAVNGTVADTSGNAWGYAVVQFSVFVQGGGKPIDLSTGLVIPTPAPIVCDASGNFSANLQRTDTILPPGSMWNITIYPFNSQYNGQALTPFTMTAALDLSGMIAAQLKPHFDAPLIIPMSNSGTVGQSQLNGSFYFDVESQTFMIRNPASGSYQPAPQSFPPPGIAVSTGSGWGPSIDPATLQKGIVSLPNGTDLNTVVANGNYEMGFPVNGPANGAPIDPNIQFLTVITHPGTNLYSVQIVYAGNNDPLKFWMRHQVGGVWDPWQVYTAVAQ